MKEIVIALENFECCERNFDANPNTNQRRNNEDGNRNDNCKNKNKGKKMCRVPGHNHEWKDCYLSLMNKKIKDEENHNMSDDDSSECSSDESMHAMRNEDDAGN